MGYSYGLKQKLIHLCKMADFSKDQNYEDLLKKAIEILESAEVRQLPFQLQMECLLTYQQIYEKKVFKNLMDTNPEHKAAYEAVIDQFMQVEWLYRSENLMNSEKLINTSSQKRFHGFFIRYLIKNIHVERLNSYLSGFRQRVQMVPIVAI